MRSSIAEARADAEIASDERLAHLAPASDAGAAEFEALHREALSAPGADSADVVTKPNLGFAFWLAVVWIGLVVFAAIFANMLPLRSPTALFTGPINHAPTLSHLFGTDDIGHDLFSQVIYGCRISMLIGGVSVAAGILIGGGLGLLAGFYRKAVDVVVVWVTDVLLTLPALILLLTLVAFLGSSEQNVILAIAVLSIPAYARITRVATLAVSQRDFVLTALSLGAKPRRVLLRDVMPLVALPIASYAPIGASLAILAEGALAFLGLAPANSNSWGDMIAAGQQQWTTAPQSEFAPMAAFFVTLLALTYIGQRAGAALDPREAVL